VTLVGTRESFILEEGGDAGAAGQGGGRPAGIGAQGSKMVLGPQPGCSRRSWRMASRSTTGMVPKGPTGGRPSWEVKPSRP